MTIVAAGRTSPRTSACALDTASTDAGPVTNMRVRTTWSMRAPASTSAASMISKHLFAWAYGSGSTEPSGQTGAVPETITRSPTRMARENPILLSNGDPELTRLRSLRGA